MIDVSASSALAVCDHCGRRELWPSRPAARSWLATHEASCAPGAFRHRQAQFAAETRERAAARR